MPVPPPTEPALASALALARERPAELSVSDLADHAGYSPFHFSRLFARHAGIGPGQYLTALRIDTAKRLLLTDDDAVIEVATAVGFTSLSSFTRRFRETVGVPPAQLRRLAERISDTPPRPFSLLRPGTGTVHAEIELPPAFSPRGDAGPRHPGAGLRGQRAVAGDAVGRRIRGRRGRRGERPDLGGGGCVLVRSALHVLHGHQPLPPVEPLYRNERPSSTIATTASSARPIMIATVEAIG